MRRADRLFQIIQILRSRKLTTARYLSERLEVSERTIYRDVRDLTLSGVPLEGEAGMGYVLRSGYDLPPLMFTEDELEAIVLGIRLVRSWSDQGLGHAAESAKAKIESVVPPRLQERMQQAALFAPSMSPPKSCNSFMADLRLAIREQLVVEMSYTREDGTTTQRRARPLCLAFFAPVWLLTAWCELRGGFRNFRLDRIQSLVVTQERFAEEDGKCLSDFMRIVTGE